MALKDLLGGGIVNAAKDAFVARSERKAAEQSLQAKISEKKLDTEAEIVFNQQEWEMLSKWNEEGTWKDEYVTVSVVSIFNIIVIGGIAAAFGYPQVLNGITTAVDALNQAMDGTDLGLIMKTTIFAAIGVYSFNKAFRG